MQTAERTRFTEAEMATVRDTDLPDLLISLGYQVKRIGRYYTTQEMDSIRIKDRRTWFRYSEGIGGDAITFLQRFYNKSFPEAVEYLLTWHGRARDSPPASTPRQTKEKEEKVPFTLLHLCLGTTKTMTLTKTTPKKNGMVDRSRGYVPPFCTSCEVRYMSSMAGSFLPWAALPPMISRTASWNRTILTSRKSSSNSNSAVRCFV